MNILSQFPEALYCPIDRNLRKEFLLNVYNGQKIAENSKVVICGICRDVANILPYTLARFDAIGKLFGAASYVIFENDSTDDTADQLQNWSNESINKIAITLKLDLPKLDQNISLERRTALSFARNHYISYLNNMKADYVIVADMDLIGGFSYFGILESLSHNKDIIGSNGLYYQDGQRLYYDSWCLRIDDWSAQDCTTTNLKQFNYTGNLIPVKSCFGGMAIYKKKCFDRVEYKNYDCDHVTLHKQMLDKGFECWLNPAQITVYNRNFYEI